MTPNIVKGSNSLPGDRYDNPEHPRNNPAYIPDSLKQKQQDQQQQSGMSSGGMDGDHSAKAMDAGANKASNVMDGADGIHEDANQASAAGVKETGSGTSMFSKDGAVGSQFKADGNVGGIAEKIGGPLSSQGMIGKNFTEQGSVGGAFQKLAEKNEQH